MKIKYNKYKYKYIYIYTHTQMKGRTALHLDSGGAHLRPT
jgi:hypothetical protein